MPYIDNPVPGRPPMAVSDTIFNLFQSGEWDIVRVAKYYLPPQFVQEIVEYVANLEPEKEEDMKIPFLNRQLAKAFGRKHKYQDIKGEVGLELECEGKSLFMSPVSFWQAISDGSLRAVDNHPPVEYVLRDPIDRSQVGEALSYLSRRLKAAGSQLVFSHRCSVHVHVNCLDLTMKQIASFLVLYFILEDLLVEFSGSERAGNLFCLRAKDAAFQIELLTAAYRTFNFGDVFNQNFRYSACNVTSLGNHGSLEFRSMRGTVDQNTIQQWVSLLLHLKDMARSYAEPSEIGQEFMHMGPVAFIDKFLTDCPVSSGTKSFFRTHSLIHQSLWDGYRTTRDVAFAVDWSNPPSFPGKVSRTLDNGDLTYDE